MRATGPAVLWRTIVTDTVERTDAGARLALEPEGARSRTSGCARGGSCLTPGCTWRCWC